MFFIAIRAECFHLEPERLAQRFGAREKLRYFARQK
jgi:hypothetical protein